MADLLLELTRIHKENYCLYPMNIKKMGKINGIRLSTRPDYIDVEILELLRKYSVDTIELGVQSLDEEVLKIPIGGVIVFKMYIMQQI